MSGTFEDCMVYTNYELLKNIKADDTGSLVEKVNTAINAEKSFSELHKEIFRLLREGKSDQKAEFALDLIYVIDPSELIVPAYIAEGLEWLQNLLHPEESHDDENEK